MQEGTQLQSFKGSAPVGNAANLKDLLQSRSEEIAKVLPRHVTPERLAKTLLVAVNRQPELLKCTQSSILESVMRAAELGLDLSGTLGEAYLVPFGNAATFIPGYRGLAKLARQTGEIGRIEADVVYENDKFDFVKGTEFRLAFYPLVKGDRGSIVGAYALAEFKDGGVQADFMTVTELEAIREMSRGKNGPAWKNSTPEMYKKTVFRRLAKWLPLSGEKWDSALAADNSEHTIDIPSVEIPAPTTDDLKPEKS